MQLFRTQALEHQNRLHGEVFLVPPLRWQAIGWLLFIAVATGILILAVGTYSRTVEVRGVLVPSALSPASKDAWTAILAVPASQIASIKAGQSVSLSLDGYPLRDFGALEGKVAAVAPDATAELKFPVKITVAPPTPQQRKSGLMLRSNWPVEGRIVIAKQSILSWLVAPKPAGSAR